MGLAHLIIASTHNAVVYEVEDLELLRYIVHTKWTSRRQTCGSTQQFKPEKIRKKTKRECLTKQRHNLLTCHSFPPLSHNLFSLFPFPVTRSPVSPPSFFFFFFFLSYFVFCFKLSIYVRSANNPSLVLHPPHLSYPR